MCIFENMNRWIKIGLKWVLLYPFVLLFCFEIALRILGYGTFHYSHYSIKSNPESPFIGDSTLGIALNPGEYSITLNDVVNFTATHNSNGTRKVPSKIKDNLLNKTVLLGCSFTYGYGVNDDQTFAALLQEYYKDIKVENLGVVGYGTVQSFMQLQKLLLESPPNRVILNFSSFHFMRNNLTTRYRVNLKIGYKNSSQHVNSLMNSAQFPYVESTDLKIKHSKWENIYTNWMGRETFATVNWMQSSYEAYRSNKEESLTLTAALIDSMNQLCIAKNVDFGIVCLDSTTETKALHNQLKNIPWLDVYFDFTNKKTTHLPYDSHPNIIGHQNISNKIIPFITQFDSREK